jgi:hypothetical protein
MPAFDFAPLVWWGLPLIAAPLLIHLINLLRHRKVRWAAMELLLASQKKYKTRVLLRQLLLLALRTAAVAGIVLALAQPRWRSALGSLFGGGRLHVVLLDDSLSMDDRTRGGDRTGEGDRAAGATAAFDRGRRVAEQVADDAAGRGDELAVGLFSEVAGDEGRDVFLVPRQPLGPESIAGVREAIGRGRRSWLATGPRAALDRAAALAAEAGEGGCTLWLVSDFRLRDWADEEAAAALRRLAEAGAAIRLVDCGAEPAADAVNLSITRLEAVGGVPATGVIVPLEVEVRNDGPGTARDVQLELREDGAGRPGLQLAEIPPGESVTRRFDVRFPAAGGHVVEARLPADRLPADDVRSCVVEVVDRVEVLLVADEAAGTGADSDAFYVATALAPGAAATTGLRPRVITPAALAATDLAAFDVIWILDVERLDAAAIAALEAHAAAGGGVVFFCGPRSKPELVNRAMFRAGEGLFPVPLAGAVELLPAAGAARVPDLVAEPHPVVAVLSGTRNPLLDAVRVERVMAVERGFDESQARGLRRLLSLRDGRPLVVEKPFGKGLVAAVLTTAAPTWNNWARGNPSWVVVMLELQSQLARQRRRAESLLVGGELRIPLVAGSDEIEVDFLVPPDGTLVRQAATPIAGGGFEARLAADIPGAYAARWRRVDGTERERVVAAHVDAGEGRLERAGRDRLARQLAGVPFRYDAADDLDPAGGDVAGVPLARPLLLGLLAVLVLEQLTAFAASYHASPVRRR